MCPQYLRPLTSSRAALGFSHQLQSAFPVHLMKPWRLPSILTLVPGDPDFLGIILDTHTSNPFFSFKAADPVALPLHTPSFLTLFSASSLEVAVPLHTQDSLSYCPCSFQKWPSLALGSPFFLSMAAYTSLFLSSSRPFFIHIEDTPLQAIHTLLGGLHFLK
ncbi:hypothetical protein L7F22_032314 [Adiantum nelumboides]|nr:hypothetical protein [Adiantum nelumboides]